MLTGRPSTAERTTPAARSVSEARAWASADSAYSRVARAPSPAGSVARASACSVSWTEVVLLFESRRQFIQGQWHSDPKRRAA